MPITNEILYLKLPKTILKNFGIWISPKKYAAAYNAYMFFVMSTQYSFLLFEFIYILNVWSDIDAASEASYLLFTQASLCYKTTVFLTNKVILAELLESMESDTFASQSSAHEECLKVLAVRIRRLCTFFMMSALTTTTLWAMIPLFDDVGNRSFPFRIWMPIGTAKSPQYELGYIYQVLTIYISAFLFIAVDSMAVSMIMFCCAQLDIIVDKMKMIQNVPMADKISANLRKKLLDDNYNVFKQCIQHHQAIISFVEKVESTFHASIFFQLSGSVAIICITGLRISIVKPNSVQFFSMVNYMVTMLSQLFLYCWCGQELTIRSQDLLEELYLCPWYEQDKRFCSTLLIAIKRMQRPLIFRAGHYIPLSRPTFIAILRSSYSYFAVLNQANGK